MTKIIIIKLIFIINNINFFIISNEIYGNNQLLANQLIREINIKKNPIAIENNIEINKKSLNQNQSKNPLLTKFQLLDSLKTWGIYGIYLFSLICFLFHLILSILFYQVFLKYIHPNSFVILFIINTILYMFPFFVIDVCLKSLISLHSFITFSPLHFMFYLLWLFFINLLLILFFIIGFFVTIFFSVST